MAISDLRWIPILVLGIVCLVKSADVFLDGAERVGRRFGVPSFLVGVTLVSVGTSFPELLSALAAVLVGSSEIVIATVVGSNVSNILLILSLSAIVGGGLRVAHEIVRVDLPFLFGSALLAAICAMDGVIGRVEGVLCLAGLATYLAYAVSTASLDDPTVSGGAGESPTPEPRLGVRVWIVLATSVLFLQFGAYMTIEALLGLSELTGYGEDVLAATILALGTSLPELSVSVRAARAGQTELAVGNVLGSNIFNSLGVVGLPALIAPLAVPTSVTAFGMPVMLGVTILCFFVLQEREMTRWDGWLLGVLYILFVGHLYGAM